MNPASPASRPDLKALTGLRGIAAWLVVFYHVRTGMGGYAPEPVMAFLAKGYLAVDFFFLLSGFVIWFSYGDRFAERGFGHAGSFLWRRLARIWPLHLAIMLATICFVLVLIATGRPFADSYPLHELPLHLLLLQNWGFTDALSWNHPAWSISTEMAAYLLFPLLAVAAPWRHWSSSALLALVALLGMGLHLYFAAYGYPTLGDDIPRTGLLRCLVQFTIGTIICLLWQRWRGNRQIATLATAIGAILFLLFTTSAAPETLVVPTAFAMFLLGMAIFAETPRNPLNNRVLHYFGEISYATYLVHFMLFIAFKIFFVSDPEQVAPYLVGLFLLLTFALSAALYHGLEKPAQRWLQSLNNRPSRIATK